MIWLLWAAIVLQGAVTLWLAREVWQCRDWVSRILDSLEAVVGGMDSQDGVNAKITAKLRALGQPID